jgi:hypothetical protein
MKSHVFLLLLPIGLGCTDKEAADPHELLAEEYRRAEPGAPGAGSEPGGSDPGHAPATRAECQAAIAHLHALAGATAKSGQAVKDGVDECLARGTSQREARCIARIRSESEIDGCAAE